MYKGFSATMIGILHPIIFFPVYEKLKLYFKKNFEPIESQNLSSKYIVISSILGKVISSLVSYPHEVLRSRLQYFKEEKNSSIIKLTRNLLAKEGVTGLYSGFFANLARIIPNYAIIFVIYEKLSEYFHLNNE